MPADQVVSADQTVKASEAYKCYTPDRNTPAPSSLCQFETCLIGPFQTERDLAVRMLVENIHRNSQLTNRYTLRRLATLELQESTNH